MKFFLFRYNKYKGLILSTFAVLLTCSLVIGSVAFNLNYSQIASTKAAYYNGNAANGGVSLMINVYENPDDVLSEMLEILKSNNAKATFFVGGIWALKNPEMLIKLKESGNEIANHGFYHKDSKKLGEKLLSEEILNTEKVIEKIAGVKTNLFAPPSGSLNASTIKVAESNGYKTIMWTSKKDLIDWRDKDENLMYERATKNVKAGDFVLCHPKKHTANSMDRILKEYAKLNLKAITVSENLA